MQIDFHHAVTFVIARLAGFGNSEADIIAYAAQYVDDATNEGLIKFDNECVYHRIASAHKMLDYKNFDDLANHHAWLPFHFLPGNGGLNAENGKGMSFMNKIICYSNSPIAQDMARECILRKTDPWALHRLGITMHVYADTWAHKGFAGIKHSINRVSNICDVDGNVDNKMVEKLKVCFDKIFDNTQSKFVQDVLPLGHGAVLSHPDQPFLKWSYVNYEGKTIERDNPKDFLEAADNMCKVMQRFLAGDPDCPVGGLSDSDKTIIDNLLRNTVFDSGDERHKVWLNAIDSKKFKFSDSPAKYVPKGEGSWKYEATGSTAEKDVPNEVCKYKPEFLASNWKLFHDALQFHQLFITNDLLPRYGICAA